MTLVVQQVRRTRVYHEIVTQIRGLIAQGRIQPGDRLPPERELADLFKASRNSVRDALRVLEQMGLIESRHGDGNYVRTLSPEELTEPLASLLLQSREQMRELWEVRRVFEPQMAAYAAQRITDEELEELDTVLREQEAQIRKGETGLTQDTEFHYGIAEAVRNPVLLRAIDTIVDLLRASRERSLQQGDRPRRSLSGHRKILEALRLRNPAQAQAAMLEHLHDVETQVFPEETGGEE
jgi:GntR family transcriptional repressor for pyruvate dehydrogenase complex